MKKLIGVLFFVSANVFAGGFSNPTNVGLVEVLTNNTIRVDAPPGQVFANPDGCGGKQHRLFYGLSLTLIIKIFLRVKHQFY